MAARSRKKPTAKKPTTKKSAAKAGKKAARKAAKKSPAKKSSKKAKPARKAAKKAAARGADKPAGTAAAKSAKKSAPRAAKKPANKVLASDPITEDSAVLAIDDLAEVDDLMADEPPQVPVKVAKAKKRDPRTPTVPRAVKPKPKVAAMDMDPEVLAFIDAIDKYKQAYCRPFPSWTEIFYILKKLGYRKG